ncbi:required for meiotic nuclear division protein 1 homolog [Aricia agestis]|uniref:required for meiotic nuclear division protein 1 homolog n=1 Tax=Aricia agestis TaxID=91739 RepID=UPI001C20630E|nr:required for meiotic nuclear division protein 1 homolog [Aricia agestis]
MSVLMSRLLLTTCRTLNPQNIIINNVQRFSAAKVQFITKVNDMVFPAQYFSARNYCVDTIQPTLALDNKGIPLKKKTIHKKAVLEDLPKKDGHYLTLAYATAHSYDLKGIRQALVQQKLYEPGTSKAEEVGDVVVANAVYKIGDEPREILFFQEGSVVFWNCTELEAKNVLDFIKPFEIESYPSEVVKKESEVMTYFYQKNAKNCHLSEEAIVLVPDQDNSLEKYAFSHAMAQSARLGAWEERLEELASSISSHMALMEREGAVHVDKKELVRKLGQVFTLRHRLNVESDLLDTPDRYWEQERLERLYSHTVAYFTIPRRTRVLNSRLSHCAELLELLWSWAADRHHVRLELWVIALILAEVCFELLHVFERYWPAAPAVAPAVVTAVGELQ